MIDNNKELIDRINLFIGSNIYTYIKDVNGYFYNGYVIELKEKVIIFKDDVIGEIPMLINDIKEMSYSKRYSHKREDFK